ncbi:hypothetical protein IAD21_02546 [Abditibacteriota bacterium]|nr:hypothetical protein IAD21_02546 [Abditibacteriota bacterium]
MTSSAGPTASSKTRDNRHLLDGTLWVFGAEALIVPVGLIITGLLTRRLGPANYGIFVLAFTLISGLEWTITSLYGRATFKLVAEATDWRPLGATILRLHLWTGCAMALLLAILARPIAHLLTEPALTSYLRWLALDIPLFGAALAHRNILIGLGHFRQRAFATIGRWVTRLVLTLTLVVGGFGIMGAVYGCLGASLVELLINRCCVRPSWRGSSFPARQFLEFAVPLLLFGLSMQLFDKTDLFFLKAMGASAEQAGYYGAARNLALAPAIFALAFTPLLLSTLSRLLREEKIEEARYVSAQSLRLIFGSLILCGLVAGCATDIVRLFFGVHFLAAGPLLAWLFAGASFLAIFAIVSTILTAKGQLLYPLLLSVPLLLLSSLAYIGVIPRYGSIGAAIVTFASSALVAVASLIVLQRLWPLALPWKTLLRSVLIAALLCYVASILPSGSWWPILKLPLMGVAAVLSVVICGEVPLSELLAWYTKFKGDKSSAPGQSTV